LQGGSVCIDSGTPDTTGLHLPSWDLLYHERVYDGDGDGIEIIDMGCYEFGADSVGVNYDDLPGIDYEIYNYPNPFNPETTISFFTTEVTENIEVNIYNVKGQRIRSFKIQNSSFKIKKVVWDGKDDRGKTVGSGVYFCRLRCGDIVSSHKMLLLK